MEIAISPVAVNLKNIVAYSHLVCILDNKVVLRRISKLRKKWEINTFYKSVEYVKWIQRLGNEGTDGKFREDVERFRKSLDIDPAFDLSLKKAIVCNEINEGDYKTAYITFIRNPRSQDIRHAIVITPSTTQKDLVDTFNKFKEDVGNAILKKSDSIYPKLKFSLRMSSEKRNEIKRDREWYWLKQSGRSYRQIAESATDRGYITIDDYRNNVIKQIKRYAMFLQSVTFRKI
ncbi:hypothetical protein M1349_02085 [Patescibacteria group bacterium]|nr:hypothetical protein [Patescibacteria group bacterium]